MKHFLLFGFFLFPFWGFGQVVDTVEMRREVDSLVNVCREVAGKGNFEESLNVIEVAEQVALNGFGRESVEYAKCVFNHGRTFHLWGKYSEAEEKYLEAKEIQIQTLGTQHSNIAEILRNLGIINYDRGDYAKAEQLYLEAKEMLIHTLGKDNLSYARILINLGVVNYIRYDYSKAESIYLEAKLIINKTVGKEDQNYSWILNNLAGVYIEKGDYDEAKSLLVEAMEIRSKTIGRKRPEYASILRNLAVLYSYIGDYAEAEPLYLEAKEIQSGTLGLEHPDYAVTLMLLANLYRDKGDYTKAELLYLEAKEIQSGTLGLEHPDYAVTLNNLANVYLLKGDYIQAELLYIETKEIWAKRGDKNQPDYAHSLNNLATLYYRQGDDIKAELLNLEASEIRLKTLGKDHPDYAHSLNNLAVIYEDKLNYSQAESLYIRAKEIRGKALGKDHPDYAESLVNLANFYRAQNHHAKASLLYLELCTTTRFVLQNASTYSSEREMLLFAIKLRNYEEDALSFFIANPSEALLAAAACDKILAQTNALLDAFIARKNAIARADSSIRSIYNEWKSCHFQLAQWYEKPIIERDLAIIVNLEMQAEQYEKELVHRSSDFVESRRDVHWQEVRDQLKPGEVAVEFSHFRWHNDKRATDSTLYAALILLPGDTAPRFIPLCEQRQLDALIPERKGPMNIYLQNLYALAPVNNRACLYQLLWEPLERIFREKGVKTVYYSPSGLLHRLNLAAIATDKSGQTLADRYRLVPMGSTRSLAVDAKARQLVVGNGSSGIQIKNALVYGGIRYDMDSTAITLNNINRGATAQDTTGGLFRYSERSGTRGDKWDYLPGTEKEANHVHDLLARQGVKSTRWRDYEATEELFKQIGQNDPSPSLLHIATHGFFFPDPATNAKSNTMMREISEPVFKISEHPLIRSGLILAGANYAWKEGHPLAGGHEDGILTAHEVSQMNLSNTELVVLSACETGLGDIKGNEGVYGLQRAFRIAGAKNVLMSLWKVPDEATEKLMTRFYQNWLEEKKPLRESFEAAQKWLRGQKGYENPYFWAGFVLIGE